MDIVNQADAEGEFVTWTTGHVVWWPECPGYLSAEELRALADELDRRNADWEARIAKDIGGEQVA